MTKYLISFSGRRMDASPENLAAASLDSRAVIQATLKEEILSTRRLKGL